MLVVPPRQDLILVEDPAIGDKDVLLDRNAKDMICGFWKRG